MNMPDSIDVLLLVPPMKPVFRPLDLSYIFYEHAKTTENLIPVQLGLLSIAAFLRREGFSCQYFDLSHFQGDPTLFGTLTNLINKYDPAIIGLTSYTSNFNATLKVVEIIKKVNPNIMVCVGGPHVTFLDEKSIEQSNYCIDVVVRGEGERVMRDLTYYYLKGLSLEENVKGITLQKENISAHDPLIKKTPDQELLTSEELSNLPPIALDLIPPKERNKFIYIPLNASRGCSYHCTFCTNPLFWNHKVRFRSPEKVIEEVLIAEELFPNRMIEFTDTILPFKMNHFENLVNLYIKETKTPIKMALTRANLTDNKRMQLMKTLLQNEGYVIIGVENADSKILELMKKPSWEEQLQALKNLKEFGLSSIPSWMIGFCGENISTMQTNLEKVDYLNRSQLVDSIILEIWIPLPGSLPFLAPKKYGVKIHSYNWDYYDRAVFPPPYSLYNPNTGEITLSSNQIWSYYLSMVSLQKVWSNKRKLNKRKDISFDQFIKLASKNPRTLYFSPAGESNINIYEDLIEENIVKFNRLEDFLIYK